MVSGFGTVYRGVAAGRPTLSLVALAVGFDVVDVPLLVPDEILLLGVAVARGLAAVPVVLDDLLVFPTGSASVFPRLLASATQVAISRVEITAKQLFTHLYKGRRVDEGKSVAFGKQFFEPDLALASLLKYRVYS